MEPNTTYVCVFRRESEYMCNTCSETLLSTGADLDYFITLYKNWYKAVKKRAICWMIIGKRLGICRDIRLLIASYIL